MTTDDLQKIFGDTIPMEAVEFMMKAPGDMTVPEARRKLNEIADKHNRPRSYDLSDPAEIVRLHRETWGYLKTCHKKHGTDFQGRQFAIDALEQLWRGPR